MDGEQIPDAATAAQIRAALPDRSTWVAANAGSGKTRVLTNRVARLLLRGALPDRILCLTYTKAAAAEMQNRLYRSLGAWAMLPEPALRAALAELGEPADAITPTALARARTLFARALETPGGLKIQTIHAFCERLLGRFPLEAGVSPVFQILEEREAEHLRAAVLDEMAETDPAFAAYAPWLASARDHKILHEIEQKRAAFGEEPEEASVMKSLGLTQRWAPGDHLARLIALVPQRQSFAAQLETKGGVQERPLGRALRSEPTAPPEPVLEAMLAVLLTNAGTPRKSGLPTKAVKEQNPDAEETIWAMQMAALDISNLQKAQKVCDETLALRRFARGYLARLDAAKAALGALDFNDLIAKAAHLLDISSAAAWVQFRLDGGIDHVLVDEAQDTSPAQWQVIAALTGEFFTDLTARETPRTVFVVGDAKQSIYSFQGADPAAFGAMRSRYATVLEEALSALEECDLLHSFRSAPPILALVDAVFAKANAHGMEEEVRHHAFHADRPGRVDLWPWIEHAKDPADPPWYLPVDMPSPTAPAVLLAAKIADWAKQTLASRLTLPGTAPPRAVRPGDIRILVRSRGRLFNAILAALTAAGIPVAGADRIKLSEVLAARDLLSLLRFLATEADDLALAEVLRSPLGGLDEAQLFALAHDRGGTLWQALRMAPAHRPLAARIGALRDAADYLRPFELLQKMLVGFGGRTALIARLGPEAEEAIDLLLDLALSYERTGPPTLVGFLDWIAASEAEVSRDLSDAGDQIRISTVHGAKGLEAPIVILPETGDPALGGKRPKILSDGGAAFAAPGAKAVPDALKPVFAAAEDRAREEHWRLLYVALTRAESWLIVCGAGKLKARPEVEWYSAVKEALAPLAEPTDEGGLTLSEGWAPQPAPKDAEPAPPADPPPLPRDPPEPPPQAPPVLRPSDSMAAEGGIGEGDLARQRGLAIHAILEAAVTTEAAAAACLRDLPDLPPSDTHAALIAEALACRLAPALAWIWGDDSLAEVAVQGLVPTLDGRPLSGRIDRLIAGAEIWAIDFKTQRSVPRRDEDLSAAILAQMAAYHAALTPLWPDRPIRMGVLWTAETRLMPLPHARVIAAYPKDSTG
ncbi:MAG: double-strand break repair helicase AddA [Pseudomonadota bacterium]